MRNKMLHRLKVIGTFTHIVDSIKVLTIDDVCLLVRSLVVLASILLAACIVCSCKSKKFEIAPNQMRDVDIRCDTHE